VCYAKHNLLLKSVSCVDTPHDQFEIVFESVALLDAIRPRLQNRHNQVDNARRQGNADATYTSNSGPVSCGTYSTFSGSLSTLS